MPSLPLRLKLLLASLGVVLAMLALLLTNSLALLQRALLHQAEVRVQQLHTLLDASLAAPLSQRDFAAVQQALELIQRHESMRYLLLLDHHGRPVAAAGWDPLRPPPPPDADLHRGDYARDDGTFHVRHELSMAGQTLGFVHFGLDAGFIARARSELLRENLLIIVLLVLLSAALLGGLAYLLTRQLGRLDRASARIAEGDYAARVPIVTGDELGRVSASFNRMAETIEQRIGELQASRHAARDHLAAAEAEQTRLASLLHAMPSGVLFIDSAGKLLYANHAFARIWRLPGEALRVGRALREIHAELAPLVRNAAMLLGQAAPGEGARGARSDPGAAVELQTLDERTVVQRLRPITDAGGRGLSLLVMHDDVTTERRTRQRAQLADRDALTGLYNRRGLVEALHQAVASAAARPGESVALLFVDLDDFKAVNDRFGHQVGDDLLRSVSAAIEGELRRGEIVARLGGDEFAVLCPGVSMVEAEAIAPRLVGAVARTTLQVRGHEVGVGCSVGVAIYPQHAADAEELIAHADAAMYHAKSAGKNGWASYVPGGMGHATRSMPLH